MDIPTEQVLRIPFAPLPGSDFRRTLGEPPNSSTQQTECRVGRGFGQHIRCVADGNPPPGTPLEIYVVDPDGTLRDNAERRRIIEQRSVDPIGEHAQQTLGVRQPVGEHLPRNRTITVPETNGVTVEAICPGNEPASDYDERHRSETLFGQARRSAYR